MKPTPILLSILLMATLGCSSQDSAIHESSDAAVTAPDREQRNDETAGKEIVAMLDVEKVRQRLEAIGFQAKVATGNSCYVEVQTVNAGPIFSRTQIVNISVLRETENELEMSSAYASKRDLKEQQLDGVRQSDHLTIRDGQVFCVSTIDASVSDQELRKAIESLARTADQREAEITGQSGERDFH